MRHPAEVANSAGPDGVWQLDDGSWRSVVDGVGGQPPAGPPRPLCTGVNVWDPWERGPAAAHRAQFSRSVPPRAWHLIQPFLGPALDDPPTRVARPDTGARYPTGPVRSTSRGRCCRCAAGVVLELIRRGGAATRRNMRREERVTVQGPVKEQQPDGMSHRGGSGGSHKGRGFKLDFPSAKFWVKIFFGWVGLRAKRRLPLLL